MPAFGIRRHTPGDETLRIAHDNARNPLHPNSGHVRL